MEATKKKKSYELNCLFALSDGQKIQSVVDKISDWVEKNSGEIISLEKKNEEGKISKGMFWVEKRYLAYPIKRNKAGFYLYVFFSVDAAGIRELSRALKLESSVIRFMITDVNGNEKKLTPGAEEISQIAELASKDPIQKKESSEEVGSIITGQKEVSIEPEEKEVIDSVTEETVTENKEEEVAIEEAVDADLTPEENREEIAPEIEATEVKAETEAEAEVEVEKEQEEQPESDSAESASEIEEEDVSVEEKEKKDVKTEEPEKDGSKKKESKKKKISLDDLDRRLDDILNEEIL